jgi:hypothetical protein
MSGKTMKYAAALVAGALGVAGAVAVATANASWAAPSAWGTATVKSLASNQVTGVYYRRGYYGRRYYGRRYYRRGYAYPYGYPYAGYAYRYSYPYAYSYPYTYARPYLGFGFGWWWSSRLTRGGVLCLALSVKLGHDEQRVARHQDLNFELKEANGPIGFASIAPNNPWIVRRQRSYLNFEAKDQDGRKRQHLVEPLTSKFGYAGVSRRMNG